jgi:hypothetical protein
VTLPRLLSPRFSCVVLFEFVIAGFAGLADFGGEVDVDNLLGRFDNDTADLLIGIFGDACFWDGDRCARSFVNSWPLHAWRRLTESPTGSRKRWTTFSSVLTALNLPWNSSGPIMSPVVA